MATTFTQAFIDPGATVDGHSLTGMPVLKVGDVTLFIEGTPEQRCATLRAIAGEAARMADGIGGDPEEPGAPGGSADESPAYRAEMRAAGRGHLLR